MGWHIDDVSIFEHSKSFRENRYELFSKNDTPIYTMILYFSSCIGGEFEFVDKVVKPEREVLVYFLMVGRLGLGFGNRWLLSIIVIKRKIKYALKKMDFRLDSKRALIKALRKTLKNKKFRENKDVNTKPFVSTADNDCKYCLEFKNFKGVEFFNKVSTTNKLGDCNYYPDTHLVKSEGGWKKLKLDYKNYFLKPKYGSQCKNIVMSFRKDMKFDAEVPSSYPYIVQEEIIPKLESGYKVDYRVYVLYIKNNNTIRSYYYPGYVKRIARVEYEKKELDSFLTHSDKLETVEGKNTNLEECLKDAQKFIIPEFNKDKSDSEVEFFLSAYDVVEDKNGRFWIIEVNWDPDFFNNKEVLDLHQDIANHWANIISNYEKLGDICSGNFIELSS